MIHANGAFAAALLWAGAAAAQQPPPPAGEAAKEDGPPPAEAPPGRAGDEEMQAIERSLAADQESAPKPAAAPSPGPVAAAIQSLNPDLSVILDVAGAASNSREVGGLGGHDPTVRGFNLQALELALGAAVDPYFRFDGNLVFGLDGVEVEEAYATTLSLPLGLQARAGEFLTRFGRINPTHPHAWSFVDQPLVIGKFLGEDGSRGVGVEGSWLTPLPWYAELIASGDMPAGLCCARSFLPEGAVPDAKDMVGTFAFKQFFPFGTDWSLLWGLSSQVGRNGADRLTAIQGTDLYLRFRPVASAEREALSLQAEALYRSRALTPERLADWGGYAQVVWNVDPRWEAGVRGEYVSGVPGDPLDPSWTAGRNRYALQGTFYPSHFSRLRLQLAVDDADWIDRTRFEAFLALEVIAGAHGAHAF